MYTCPEAGHSLVPADIFPFVLSWHFNHNVFGLRLAVTSTLLQYCIGSGGENRLTKTFIHIEAHVKYK